VVREWSRGAEEPATPEKKRRKTTTNDTKKKHIPRDTSTHQHQPREIKENRS
jgi:hypothetical protein